MKRSREIAKLLAGAMATAAILGSVWTSLALSQDTAAAKPTSLSDAQAAIDANLRTSEGKAFDDRMGKEFLEKHLAPLRHVSLPAAT